MKYLVLLGRVLFSLIFLFTIFGHFSHQYVEYAAANGVPLASILVPLSGIIAILGGLSIVLGYKAKWGGWLIVLFLVPVTFLMHDFWAVADPMSAVTQRVMFMKNLSMLGGALLITYFGAGPMSLDSLLRKRTSSDEKIEEAAPVERKGRERAGGTHEFHQSTN